MKKVFICSPFRGDVTTNTANAERYCRFACDQGCVPFAPHLFFPRFLSDNNEAERNLGILMGLSFLESCSELWWFGEKPTVGMKQEINYADIKNIKIRHFTDELTEVTK